MTKKKFERMVFRQRIDQMRDEQLKFMSMSGPQGSQFLLDLSQLMLDLAEVNNEN